MVFISLGFRADVSRNGKCGSKVARNLRSELGFISPITIIITRIPFGIPSPCSKSSIDVFLDIWLGSVAELCCL